MSIVLDACAMIVYLRGEPGADVVEALLLDKNSPCLTHAVNLCEVFYDFMRAADEIAAHAAIADLESMGLVVREDMDAQFWQEVGRYKSTMKKISSAIQMVFEFCAKLFSFSDKKGSRPLVVSIADLGSI